MINQIYPIKLKKVNCTCRACPLQIEGETEDGKFFYLRYRWGSLKFGVWENENDFLDVKADRSYLFSENVGGQYSGTMGEEELRRRLQDYVIFPDGAIIQDVEVFME